MTFRPAQVQLRRASSLLLAALCLLILTGCSAEPGRNRTGGRLRVIATLFPIAEFAKNIGQERADVSLLLPPGIEPHAYEPTPHDIARVRSAQLFLYSGRAMEPWAEDLLKDRQPGRIAVAAGDAVSGNPGASDPHLWLDFSFAEEMLDAILGGFVRSDPSSAEFYRTNADAYRKQLRALDRKYRDALTSCAKRTIVSGGHATFGHLARRYGLGYVAAYGQSPNADPSPKELARLSNLIRQNRLRFLFQEELLEPRISRTLSQETGAGLLLLHGGHNVSRSELEAGATFTGIMEQNLENLRKGLECPNP